MKTSSIIWQGRKALSSVRKKMETLSPSTKVAVKQIQNPQATFVEIFGQALGWTLLTLGSIMAFLGLFGKQLWKMAKGTINFTYQATHPKEGA